MARALALAQRGLYTTDPNPRVGCILVRDGAVVGEGWHERAGAPHAEVLALAAAGSQAHGATAYITLEPCCHYGRTPPCTQALLAAGIRRLVVALEDPNPLVAGKGIAALQEAGIRVESGVLAAPAEALNPGFIQRMRSQRPFVRCKLAFSLDGRTAMASGESQWITGEAARLDGQRLRARASAVMTGVATVLADDPGLNVRLPEETPRQPLRVILDTELATPPTARTLSLEGPVLILTACANRERQNRLRAAGAEVQLDPPAGPWTGSRCGADRTGRAASQRTPPGMRRHPGGSDVAGRSARRVGPLPGAAAAGRRRARPVPPAGVDAAARAHCVADHRCPGGRPGLAHHGAPAALSSPGFLPIDRVRSMFAGLCLQALSKR